MFGLFNKKKTNDTDGIRAIIKTIYDGMDDEFAPKVFYGNADKACEVLIPMGRIISGTEVLSRDQLELTAFVYSHLWIRSHGGFDPSFSEEEYIRERMKERFDQIDPRFLDQAIDIGVDFIRENDEEAFNAKSSEKDKVNKELIDTINQTMTPPIGDASEAWTWACEKYRYLKDNGADEDGLLLLAVNMIMHLTDEYAKNYEAFYALVYEHKSTFIAFGKTLEDGQKKRAKKIADPYIDNVIMPGDLPGDGYCFQNEDEERVFRLTNPKMDSYARMELNLTSFIISYCQILDGMFHSEEEPDDEKFFRYKQLRKKTLMIIASRLSPCNPHVWKYLAQCCDKDEKDEWKRTIDTALNVCTEKDILGNLYADMAIHYSISDRNKRLADALSTKSREYSNDIMLQFLFSRLELNVISTEEADVALAEHDIQNGFSDLVQPVIEEHLLFERYPTLDKKMALLMSRVDEDAATELNKIVQKALTEVDSSGVIQPENETLWDAVYDDDQNNCERAKCMVAKELGERLIASFDPIPVNNSLSFYAQIEFHEELQNCITMELQEVFEHLYRKGIFKDNEGKGESTRIILNLQNSRPCTNEFRQAVTTLEIAYDNKIAVSVTQ